MAERTMQNCRILVVEDEYMLADELSRELENAGAFVVGPFPAVREALNAIRSEERLDCAVLDINLGGERVDPVADELVGRDVPFMFVTGYDCPILPEHFADIACCEKPINITAVTGAIKRMIS